MDGGGEASWVEETAVANLREILGFFISRRAFFGSLAPAFALELALASAFVLALALAFAATAATAQGGGQICGRPDLQNMRKYAEICGNMRKNMRKYAVFSNRKMQKDLAKFQGGALPRSGKKNMHGIKGLGCQIVYQALF